ncbi:DUF2244 domain-containing protein [Chthonobacter rhizosphaerae]|uniref:DUF2244 domain-containing protein n=1 Tax=Chthonobacter rhizosphaerae TaxID=2735553 RepID=UPI0015EE995A|nr:DUF2244 domain-containing protein [Chthonobacter rhizosphaerae]
MTTDNPTTPDPSAADTPFFSARLTPYRSLGPRGFLVLMLVVGALCFVSGVMFLVIGAWPVFWFFGLDVLLVYVAFRINYDAARAFEEVHVSVTDVHVVRVSPKGRTEEHHLNPLWARLQVTRLEDEGVVAMELVSHGKAVGLGDFLNPPDRETFAEALSKALATARRGGPDALPAGA